MTVEQFKSMLSTINPKAEVMIGVWRDSDGLGKYFQYPINYAKENSDDGRNECVIVTRI